MGRHNNRKIGQLCTKCDEYQQLTASDFRKHKKNCVGRPVEFVEPNERARVEQRNARDEAIKALLDFLAEFDAFLL